VQAQDKGKAGKADWALNHIQKLYTLESKLKSKEADTKYQQRQQFAAPLLLQLWEWLEKSKDCHPKESYLGKDISYTQNQLPKLIKYLDDGQLNIDNNRAESAVKPFVIGRKT
jgi:transposase